MPRAARFEANAVVADGTYYIQDPFGAVYALDGATGARLWKWTPTYDAGFGLGSGSRKPGVAIGEGKVFAGLADGQLYGLDQTTGGVLWQTEVTPWRTGGKTSSAPIYVNGMVLIGDSAGDNGGSSATMQAFTANNGKRIWSWGVDPDRGPARLQDVVRRTPPATPTTARTAAARCGSHPIIDPKLNLAIFGTGNPVPWNSRGPGMNLYTDSIVALNLYTGQLVWYYQTTHHDLWDADLPNNGVMFTAKYKIKGKMVSRPGVAYVNKYGMTFILDRRDRQAAAADPGGQGAAEHRARREHVADTADPAGGQRARQQAGQAPGAPARTATARRPTRTCRSRRRSRRTASRSRSAAPTTRTTRRSTSCSRSR